MAKPRPRAFSVYFKRFELLIEFKSLLKNNPNGLYVTPSPDDIYVWHGVLFIHGSYYSGGVFKFRVDIPPDYPDAPPKLVVTSPLYHPLVDPASGQFSISQQFPTWQPLHTYIIHVLQFFRRAFTEAVLLNLDEQHCPNKEAWALFKSDHEQFTFKAKDSAQRAARAAQDPTDAYPIAFTVPPTATPNGTKLDDVVKDALGKIFEPGAKPIALREKSDWLKSAKPKAQLNPLLRE